MVTDETLAALQKYANGDEPTSDAQDTELRNELVLLLADSVGISDLGSPLRVDERASWSSHEAATALALYKALTGATATEAPAKPAAAFTVGSLVTCPKKRALGYLENQIAGVGTVVNFDELDNTFRVEWPLCDKYWHYKSELELAPTAEVKPTEKAPVKPSAAFTVGSSVICPSQRSMGILSEGNYLTGVGEVTYFDKLDNTFRVDWPLADGCWYWHYASELELAPSDGLVRDATAIFATARAAVARGATMTNAKDATFLREFFTNVRVRASLFSEDGASSLVERTARSALAEVIGENVLLTPERLAALVAFYDEVTGYVDPATVAKRERIAALKAELAALEA